MTRSEEIKYVGFGCLWLYKSHQGCETYEGEMVECTFFLIKLSPTLIKLKFIHTCINVQREKSGVHWDNKGGCNIGPGMEEVWQEHLKVGVNMILSALNVSDHII